MVIIDFGNDINADWIKHVVGRDGLTVRDSELALYDWQTLKHLAGRHDQKSHAPKTRAISAKSVLRARLDIPMDQIDVKAAGYYLDAVDIVTRNGVKRGDTFSNEELAKMVAAGQVSMSATGMSIDGAAASMLKDKIVTDLSKATGLDYNRVNTMIAAWAATTNDNKPESLGLQQAASEQFDAPITPWQQKRIDSVSSIAADNEYNAKHFWRAAEEGKQLLQAMYGKTQQELKDEGIKSVTLYRGVVLKRGWAEGLEKDMDYPIQENAMESWSLSPETARGFAYGMGETEKGIVFQAEVPVERILATPKTGFGCLGEFEFVVLGSKEDDYARVVGVY